MCSIRENPDEQYKYKKGFLTFIVIRKGKPAQQQYFFFHIQYSVSLLDVYQSCSAIIYIYFL